MKKIALAIVLCVSTTGSAAETPVDAFLRMYNSLYQGLSNVAQGSAWVASTDVSDAHEAARTTGNEALAVFAGDRGIIEAARGFLSDRRNLPPMVARQLDKILLAAAEGPGTIPTVTHARVAAESHQSSVMDGFVFHIDGKPVSANDIDETLQHSRDLPARLKAWDASKEIGKPLKPGIVQLQKLRNQVAREMKHSGYFALEVADYDMTDERDDEDARRLRRRHASALQEAARLRAHEAGRALQAAGAEADPGALDRQPLGAGVGRRGRGRGQPRPAVQGQEAGVDRADGGEVLHVDGVPVAAEDLLGALGHVRAAGRLQAPQERARQRLAHRSTTRTCARS